MLENINIIAPINGLGYGITGFNIVKTLMKIGVKVSLFPISTIESQFETKEIKEARENSKFFDKNAPCIRLWHQHDMSHFVGKGRHIGFPIFELNSFSKLEQHHLNSCDNIMVCSNWAKNVICHNTNHAEWQVSVVPLGVDTTIFTPSNFNLTKKTTVFMNVGKWEVRKGHKILPKIFEKAFREDDDVELWLVTDNPFCSEQEKKEFIKPYKESKLANKITIFDRLPNQQVLASLMRKADCGIFPSKAEGWNLDLLEMMACGKHVIASNCTAHTEFCNTDNTYLVKPTGLEPAVDNKFFFGQGYWASFNEQALDDFADHMRLVYESKKNGSFINNDKGIETANKFSWENTATKIVESL